MAVFRPSFQLRRQLGAKIPPVLDLDGICLDEKWRAEGPLAEEFEGEDEQPIAPAKTGESRRASTSAKSRDSGISY